MIATCLLAVLFKKQPFRTPATPVTEIQMEHHQHNESSTASSIHSFQPCRKKKKFSPLRKRRRSSDSGAAPPPPHLPPLPILLRDMYLFATFIPPPRACAWVRGCVHVCMCVSAVVFSGTRLDWKHAAVPPAGAKASPNF